MTELISDIMDFVRRHPPPDLPEDVWLSEEDFRRLGYTPQTLFPIVPKVAIESAEAKIGFALPPLLKALYTEVSNGIAGFRYDIMGIEGGCRSDSGDLVEAYFSFRDGVREQDGISKHGLLPFCDWGCATYSCVDCTDSAYPIVTCEYGNLYPERYSLSGFFEQWLQGKVRFLEENFEVLSQDVINPFTGQPTKVIGRGKRKS